MRHLPIYHLLPGFWDVEKAACHGLWDAEDRARHYFLIDAYCWESFPELNIVPPWPKYKQACLNSPLQRRNQRGRPEEVPRKEKAKERERRRLIRVGQTQYNMEIGADHMSRCHH